MVLVQRTCASARRLLIFGEPCCLEDTECWGRDWTTSQRPTLLFSISIVLAIRHWLRLGLLSLYLPLGLRVRYSPLSFTTGLLTGLAIWWTTALGTQQVSPFMHYSNIPNAQPAIQELAVRCTLWLQLVDARVQATVESNLQWSVLAVRLALTALGSLLAFCLAEPLQALQYRLAYRWDLGDWDMGAQPSTIPFASFCKASFGPLFRRIAMVGVALLPVAILLSYSYTDPTVIRIRAEAGWLFNILLCSLIKPVLQDYLQEALLQVVGVLARSPDESDDDASSRISFPFTSRSENVVRMGSQLVKLPLLLPILLAAAHLCSSYTSSNSIYTSAYGGPLLDTKLTQNWEQEQALGLRSLVDQGTKTCPTSQKQSKVFASKRTVATVASISDPLQLLTASSATSGSLIQTLKVVQRLMKNHSTTKDSTELEVHLPALQNTLQALARHPFLTSSIVLPFLDFIGYVLCCLWTITFVQRFLLLWKPMRAMRLRSRKLTRLPVVIPSTVY